MPVPVYIISGFLGSGKTTLIHHIVETFSDSASDSARMFIIHDELGKFPIDGESFDDQKKSWIVSLQPGHPPCAFLRELIGTLRYAGMECNPDCILIELNGLTHPGTVARLVQSPAFEHRLTLGGVITVVNPVNVLNHVETLVEEQIKTATSIVMNKADSLDKGTWQQAHERVVALARKDCPIFRSTRAKVDADALLTSASSGSIAVQPIPQPVSVQKYAVMSYFSHETLSGNWITTLLDRHKQHIVRAKGLLQTDSGAKIIQCTRNEFSMLKTSRNLTCSKFVMITETTCKDAMHREFSAVFGSENRKPTS
jgi:G3E family GTPase